MNKEEISALQKCLTVYKQGLPRPIVQVERLIQRHTPQAVEAYLIRVQSDYRKRLYQLFEVNPRSPQLDHLVVAIFRLGMALKLMRDHQARKQAA